MLKSIYKQVFDRLQGYKNEKNKLLQEVLELFEVQKKLIAMLKENVANYEKKQGEKRINLATKSDKSPVDLLEQAISHL